MCKNCGCSSEEKKKEMCPDCGEPVDDCTCGEEEK